MFFFSLADKLKIPSILMDFTGDSMYLTQHKTSWFSSIFNRVNGFDFMNNMQKLTENVINKYLFNFHHIPMQNQLLKEYYGESGKNVNQLIKTSVVLSNRHFLTNLPKQSAFGSHHIGGFHLQTSNGSIHPVNEEYSKNFISFYILFQP